jgi:Kef-type K+ transport system membrane component KefB/mannitol/fructose-specific phosphotransferase system IIA component (Ntr-type)
MLVAGLEMDLNGIMKQKRKPLIIGFCSVVFPFAWGFGVTYANPTLMGATSHADHTNYAFFVGTALAITAMPVVAKTLRDVGLYRSQLGQVVMSAATIDDLIGWSLFAIVLSLSNASDGIPALGLGGTIAVSVVFVFFTVIFGRLAFPRFFLWIQATFSFPGGVIGFVIGWTLCIASFATYIGLHNTLGAFLVGASLSNNKYLRSTTRELIDVFVTYALAPIFFGYIAINADFIADFDVGLVAMVLLISCIGKLMGASLGARIAGSSWREAFALATCMNSRGAMEILLATVALNAGVIDGRMFVALIFMAIFTSLLPGPILRRILRRKERKPFTTYMPNPDGFVPELEATDMERAVKELCTAIGHSDVAPAMIAEQQSTPTGNHDQLAILHTHVATIRHTKIALGLSRSGIDFSGQFGYPGDHPHFANIIVIILFPENSGTRTSDLTLEDDMVQQICLVFSRLAFRAEFIVARKYLEVVSLIKAETHRVGLHSTQEEQQGISFAAAWLGGNRQSVTNTSSNNQPPAEDVVQEPLEKSTEFSNPTPASPRAPEPAPSFTTLQRQDSKEQDRQLAIV